MLRTNALLRWNQSLFMPLPGRGGHLWDFRDPRDRALSQHQHSSRKRPDGFFRSYNFTSLHFTRYNGPPYDIWTSHVKYHEHLVQIMVPPLSSADPLPSPFSPLQPGSNPLLVTVVRDPVARLVSAWHYYTTSGVLRPDTPLDALLWLPQAQSVVHSEFHPNGMCIELSGVDAGAQHHAFPPAGRSESRLPVSTATAWRGVREDVRARRLIALVTERLDDSLNLLWHRVNSRAYESPFTGAVRLAAQDAWPAEDLVYRHVNPRTTFGVRTGHSSRASNTTKRHHLNATEEAAVRRASIFDQELYETAVLVLNEDMRQLDGVDISSTRQSCDGFEQQMNGRDVSSGDGNMDGEGSSYGDVERALELCHEPLKAIYQTDISADVEGRRSCPSASLEAHICRCHLLGMDDIDWSAFVHHHRWTEGEREAAAREPHLGEHDAEEVVDDDTAIAVAMALAIEETAAFAPVAECSLALSTPEGREAELEVRENMKGTNEGYDKEGTQQQTRHKVTVPCVIAAETANGLQNNQAERFRIVTGVQEGSGSKERGLLYGCPLEDEPVDRRRSNSNGPMQLDAQPEERPKKKTVLLIQRGGCSFLQKVRKAESKGYDAVLVVDFPSPTITKVMEDMDSKAHGDLAYSIDDEVPNTPGLGLDHGASIPLLAVSAFTGRRMLHAISSGFECSFYARVIHATNLS